MEHKGAYKLIRLDITILTPARQSYQPIHFTDMRPSMRDIWSALYNGFMIKRAEVVAMRFAWKDNQNEDFAITVDLDGLNKFNDDEFPQSLDEQLTNWESRSLGSNLALE